MKTLTSLRISKLTASQLESLKASTGLGQSEIITTAIDRMYREESKMNKQIEKLIVNRDWNTFAGLVADHCETDTDGLDDWLSHGDYTFMMSKTFKSLAAEWDEFNTDAE